MRLATVKHPVSNKAPRLAMRPNFLIELASLPRSLQNCRSLLTSRMLTAVDKPNVGVKRPLLQRAVRLNDWLDTTLVCHRTPPTPNSCFESPTRHDLKGPSHGSTPGPASSVLLLEVAVNPQELLLLVQHLAQIAKARIFLLQPGLELPQHAAIGADDSGALYLRPTLLGS